MTLNAFDERLCSPCCHGALDIDSDTATCAGCGSRYSRRSYGFDLVPSDIASRHQSFGTWTEVQHALAAWRARTWTETPAAEARTRDTRQLADAFLQLTGVRGHLLDVGCGSGWIAEPIAAMGASYFGIDPTPVAETYAFPFARAVSDCLPFRSGSFESIVFFSSLDYSLDLGATLAEARRVLAAGGGVAIATPIHRTREASGERLHHHRFLDGDLEGALGAVFGQAVQKHPWRDNYHFLWTHRS